MSVVRDPFVLRSLWCGLALILAAGAPLACAGDVEDTPAEIRAVISELDRPLLRDREAAVERLVEMLPAVRPRITEALRNGSWTVQLHAAQILARDGSAESMTALLAHLGRTDEAQATLINLAVVKDVAASAIVLKAFRSDDAPKPKDARTRKRYEQLRQLLLRAEVEEKFLARKSKTGGTGYYRGQYEDLQYERELALEVCTRIAMDKAFAVPGLFRTGRYRFLRPHPHEYWEVQGMATNAVSDLAKPTDKRFILRLDAFADSLEIKCINLQKRIRMWGRFSVDDDYEEFVETQLDLMEAVGNWGDILSTLCIIDEDSYADEVEEYLAVLDNWQVYQRSLLRHTRAGMLIRVGWYERAIQAYRDVLMRSQLSRATSHYNLACAYASWSREPGDRDAEVLKIRAVDELTNAVEAGWSDVGWMQEDRDLDPIKQMDDYKALVERIKREVLPPEPGPPAVGSPDGDEKRDGG